MFIYIYTYVSMILRYCSRWDWAGDSWVKGVRSHQLHQEDGCRNTSFYIFLSFLDG